MDRYYKRGDKVKEYSILKVLGEGRYGIAYLGVDKENKKYVIKQLKKDMLEETRKKLFYEKAILEYLDDPHFPKFISEFNDGNAEGYILEYMEGIVIHNLLLEGYVLERNEIFNICNQLLDIVEILHNKKIIHRDIRTPNVIVNEDGKLILIDFGLARVIDKNRYREEEDYWYIGSFLVRLYYSLVDNSDYESYSEGDKERPWYEELDLTNKERIFLKRLLGINSNYTSIESIRRDLYDIEEEFK